MTRMRRAIRTITATSPGSGGIAGARMLFGRDVICANEYWANLDTANSTMRHGPC
jgi:hypothetical protein